MEESRDKQFSIRKKTVCLGDEPLYHFKNLDPMNIKYYFNIPDLSYLKLVDDICQKYSIDTFTVQILINHLDSNKVPYHEFFIINEKLEHANWYDQALRHAPDIHYIRIFENCTLDDFDLYIELSNHQFINNFFEIVFVDN